jgi:hypothetical protein
MSIDRVIQFVPSLGERHWIGWCASFVRANFVTVFLLLIPNMPALAGQDAGLTRPVVVGDSLAASVVASQANTVLPVPLIVAPGITNVLTLVSLGPPPVTRPAPGVSGGTARRGPSAFFAGSCQCGCRAGASLCNGPLRRSNFLNFPKRALIGSRRKPDRA